MGAVIWHPQSEHSASEGSPSATKGNRREGRGGSPCPAIPDAAGHQPPPPRPGRGTIGSSGSQTAAGHGHFTASYPEKQGFTTSPAALESKCKEAFSPQVRHWSSPSAPEDGLWTPLLLARPGTPLSPLQRNTQRQEAGKAQTLLAPVFITTP